MNRRAMVVHEPGEDGLAAARATADFVSGLQHRDLHPLLGECDGGGESIGPTAHHGRCAHATAPCPRSCFASAADQVTWIGIGPLGSHGCSLTASATFQVPRSITPSAASMTWYFCTLLAQGCDSAHTTMSSPGSNPAS